MAFDPSLLGTFILSLLLGSLIGVQREIRQQKENKKDLAGFRTFTIISLLGFICGFISKNIFKTSEIVILILLGLIILLATAYYSITRKTIKNYGIMTQILIIVTFLIGLLISYNYVYLSVLTAITITLLLFLGQELHTFAKKLTKNEIFASLKFVIISAVILPLLPNKNYTLLNIPIINKIFINQTYISHNLLLQLNVFNPYHLWLIVVFVSGIAFTGYILTRLFGTNKGIFMTGFLGGLMSSTALTTSFSIESKKEKLPLIFALGVIIACSTMFFRILFEISVINISLLNIKIIALLIMGIIGFTISYLIFYFRETKTTKKIHKIKLKSPFSLKPALTFAIIFLLISTLSKLFSILYGDKGIYLLSIFSGITDVDAITITLSNLAREKTITNSVATIGITLAAITNTIFKAGIAYYFGDNKFSRIIIYGFLVILTIGIITLLFTI